MKLCYNEGCTLHNATLEQELALCDAAGFDYMELRIDKLRTYLKTHTVEELQAFFRTHRLKPHAINGIYFYGAFLGEGDLDVQRSQALMEDFLFACQIGQAVGAPSIVVVPDMNRDEVKNEAYDRPWAEIFRDTVRVLTRLSELAAPYGMNLGLELVGSKRCSVRTLPQAKEIVSAVNRANVGYTIDAFNLYLYEKSNDFSLLSTLEPAKIFAVHINNSEDIPLEELRQAHRTYPDQGTIDLGSYLSNLKQAGYNGMVSIEFFRPDCWALPPEEVIAKAFQTTKDVLQRFGCLE